MHHRKHRKGDTKEEIKYYGKKNFVKLSNISNRGIDVRFFVEFM